MQKFLCFFLIACSSICANAESDPPPRYGDGVRGIQYIPRESYMGTYFGFNVQVAIPFNDLSSNLSNLATGLTEFNQIKIDDANRGLFFTKNWGLQNLIAGYLSPPDENGTVLGGGYEIGRRVVHFENGERGAFSASSLYFHAGYRDSEGVGVLFSLSYVSGQSSKTNGPIEFSEISLGPIVNMDNAGNFVFRVSAPLDCPRGNRAHDPLSDNLVEPSADIDCGSLGRFSFDFQFYIQ